MRESFAEAGESRWESLYKVGGLSGIIAGSLTLFDMIVFVVWLQPGFTETARWFALYQKNWLIGLLDLDLLGIIGFAALVPTLLALYITLRRVSQSFAAIGTVLFFVALAVFFASNPAFPMLSLSGQYAADTTDAQKSMLLAAGQGMLATFQYITWGQNFILYSIALLIISAIMLRSHNFSRKTAWTGIIAIASVFCSFLPFPIIGAVFAFINGIGLGIWCIMVGRRLLQLEPNVRKEEFAS